MMAVLLNVPYAEKDQAKALGAWWNNDLKKWYVPSEKNYSSVVSASWIKAISFSGTPFATSFCLISS